MIKLDPERLMEGAIRQLQAEAKYFSELTTHNAGKGRLNETRLVRTMRRYHPEKIGVERRFGSAQDEGLGDDR